MRGGWWSKNERGMKRIMSRWGVWLGENDFLWISTKRWVVAKTQRWKKKREGGNDKRREGSILRPPDQRSKGRKLMTDKHGEIYGGTFSISSDSKATPISPKGKKTFVQEHKDRNIGSHMKGAAAMSMEEVSPSGRKVHQDHNVSQLKGMTPNEGSEVPRASRKLINNMDKDTLSGSGVDPGELNLKIGLRKISKKNHFDGSSVGVASNHEGEVSGRGLKRLPVSNESHFKSGHVAEDDVEPARGLKRIVVANNMDNAGLSNSERKVGTSPMSKKRLHVTGTMPSTDDDPCWTAMPSADNPCAKLMRENPDDASIAAIRWLAAPRAAMPTSAHAPHCTLAAAMP